MFETIARDLAHALRLLLKERGFTLICVISLGIGIGAMLALVTFTRAINSVGLYWSTLNSCDVSTLIAGTPTGRLNDVAVQISSAMAAASDTPANVNP